MLTEFKNFTSFQTVVLAAAIISRMVLARPGYVPAHAIDYYVSVIQLTRLLSTPPPLQVKLSDDYDLCPNPSVGDGTPTEGSELDTNNEIK